MAGGAEFAFGQNVMDQATVQTAVPVLERMDVDEAEGRRRLQDGVERALYALVRGDHPVRERSQILRACADEFGQRFTLVVPLADEDAVRAQALRAAAVSRTV